MKFLRGKTTLRVLAVTLNLIFVQSVFLPAYVHAFSSGPHQAEYTSYESPGSTDMVNLSTGDFSFSLPILEVPSPEGSFSVPLFYSAGIGLEQPASWVGLGWNINVGSITRNINEFPDDAAGETHSVRVVDMTGTRGWESSILGLVNFGWNTDIGHYGSASFFGLVSASWNKGLNSVGVAGINVSSDGVDLDPVQFIMAAVTVASWGAAAGAAKASALATNPAATGAMLKQVATEAVVGNMALDAAMSLFSPVATPSPSTGGVWDYQKTTTRSLVVYEEYHYWLDQTRGERMYGVLHLGKATNTATFTPGGLKANVLLSNGGVSEPLKVFTNSTGGNVTTGVASDINYKVDEGSEYYEVNNPAFLAIDNYVVNGPGISGTIMPYRLDAGSVSMPRAMTQNHDRLAPVLYKDYKVPFVYKGSISNNYYHHVGGSTSVSSPSFYLGLSRTLGTSTPATNNSLTYNLNDVILKNQRVRPDVANFLTGATRNILPQANHIEWLSNVEIKASTSYPATGFLDFISPAKRANFRTTPVPSLPGTPNTSFGYTSSFSPNLPVDPFVMADADVNEEIIIKLKTANGQEIFEEFSGYVESKNAVNGTIVINSLYELYLQYAGQTMSFEITYYKDDLVWDTAIGGYVITGANGLSYHYALPIYDYNSKNVIVDATDAAKRAELSRSKPFANTWLLTAITGTDFVDRNSNGIADEGDWGYWVKFNYGRTADFLVWRTPATGLKRDPTNDSEYYAEGRKQEYHLNSIQTRSHIALFIKDNKPDGGKKLNEIILLSIEKYKKLVTTPLSFPDCSNQFEVNYESYQISTAHRDFINKNCIKRIVFTYDNSLCKKLASGVGKLTLKAVSIFGLNNAKLVPDYKFEYGINPNYDQNHWDGWGMFNPNGTADGITHQASPIDADGTVWSLSKIISPLGSSIEINYERDHYAAVSGNQIPEKQGGDVRVASIITRDEFDRTNKIRYLYKKEDGSCSGVVAKEPEYIKVTDFPLYDLPYYPMTPVIYSRVEVLNGILVNDADYHTKTVYEFETPNENLVTYTKTLVHDNELIKTGASGSEYLTMNEHKILDYTSSIGALKAIKMYNKTDANPYSSIQMIPTQTLPNNQGVYTQGTLMFERIVEEPSTYHKVNKMTTITYPSTLKKIVKSKDGFSSESENVAWDFISGQVLEKLEKSSLGINLKTVIKPAYTFYTDMGPKALNASNKNMLGQVAATYTYKVDGAGSPVGLLSAQLQTWRNDWSNYRYFTGTGYSDDPQSATVPVRRKSVSYTWKGDYTRLNPDGTHKFAPADEFAFSSTPNSNWQKLGEHLRYDHYSLPIENMDLNGLYSATKVGYDGRTKIAEAGNAQYHEIAFSGAEDLIPGGTSPNQFFGGEVGLGSGLVKYKSKGETTVVHTGDAVVSLTSGYSFVYKTSGLTAGKTYRASVWTNSVNGRIYYKLGVGGTEVLSATPTTETKAGPWYRIDLNIPMASATSIEVGVKSSTGTVLFDDFRFQPADASMVCYVYNPLDYIYPTPDYNTYTYVLDNANVFTMYKENESGLLSQVYVESIKYGGTLGYNLISEAKKDYRRFHTNQ